MIVPANGASRAEERPDYEDIRKPAAIGVMLEDIAHSRAQIALLTGQSDERYSSAIVSVDTGRGTFLIDEVLPLSANRNLVAGMQLRITAKVREVDVSFRTLIVQANRRDGGLHELQVPTSIRRYQKRSFYRAKCSQGGEVRLRRAGETREEVLTAQLRDLSIGGVGLRVPLPAPPYLQVGVVFPDCEIILDRRTVVRCATEIRHLEVSRQSRFAIAGCRLLNLDAAAQNALARVVARLELEQLARRK
ncbi:MAG: flagellar brake protein [Chromatiaceae bacterium]|jgi:c-di-GMP-binding flagellar brake protein YcgR